MKIAILGFGKQGQSALEYWSSPENSITVCDLNKSSGLPSGVTPKLGSDYLQDLDNFDLIVRSPSIHPRDIVAANGKAILDKVTTVTNEFMRRCPTKNTIGVTGTKGKGTTSTLITKMLEAAGKTVHLGGNIGIPPLELLKNNIQPDDWVVLELANFQLIDLNYSPHIAVCLMVEPEHLNWHADMDEYIRTKQQLFVHQTADDIAIYFSENKYSKQIASAGKAQTIPFFTPPGAFVESGFVGIEGQIICNVSEIKLLGKHNWQNICAAITAVWQITQNTDAMHAVLSTLSGLPHRIEFVRQIGGVRYYNDSFSSAPGATIAAIEAIPGSKVLIMGGVDKNHDLTELTMKICEHKNELRQILIIGEVANKVANALDQAKVTNFEVLTGVNMEQIVRRASSVAEDGDTVILSPGTSSFDMFKNFEDRGLQFKEAVSKL